MKGLLRRMLCCVTLAALLTAGVPVSAADYYSDVPENFWAGEDIQRCVQEGWFFLESDGSFGVGKELSRSEFVVILCRFFDWKPASAPRMVYEDVATNEWYAGAVETAYRQGLITAQSSVFRPEDPVTRSEAAAMLIRALGYGSIAGLVQDLPLPFEDVGTNAGYITMAYGLGLMDGSSVNTFSPNDGVTREQMASILMRLYGKLNDTRVSKTGVASSAKGLGDLTGFEAVGIPACHLVYNGLPQISSDMTPDEVEAIQNAVRDAGAKPLLYVTGGPYQLREANGGDMAAVLLEAVSAGNYEGLFLDISGLTTTTQRNELNAVAEALREGLGRKLLYLVVEAPAWQGAISGYDYAVLGQYADRIVLRVDYPAGEAGGIPTAPLEPIEEIYYALNRLRGLVDAEQMTILLTSTGSLWNNGERHGAVSGAEITKFLEDAGALAHYSSRYACAYLEQAQNENSTIVWFLNGQSIEERVRLAKLFGAGCLCLTELTDVLPEVLEGMRN